MSFRSGGIFAAGMLALGLTACGGGGSDSSTRMSVSPGAVAVSSKTTSVAPRASLTVSVNRTPERQVFAFVEHTVSGVARAEFTLNSETSGQVAIFFKDPDRLGPGTYTDTVTLKGCYDSNCTEQMGGSPKRISVSYTVTGQAPPSPEPDIPPTAAPTDSGVLPAEFMPMSDHDAVDAAYSPALEAIVMVSSWPSNALYVYDVASDTERMVPLSERPSAVSLSPDGLTAAIIQGDRSLAHIDLRQVGLPGDPRPFVIPLFTSAFDLALDGNGRAHVFPGRNGPEYDIYSIQLGSNTRLRSTAHAIENMRPSLHSSGSTIYAATTTINPAYIEKYEIAEGKVNYLYNWPYHNEHQTCHNLWLSATGNRVYTACGNVFRASEYRVHDLTYMGAIALFDQEGVAGIQALSDSAAAGEIALIETNFQDCYSRPHDFCRNRLGLYDRQTLAPIASYSIPSNYIAGFVFHSSDGSEKYVIARTNNDPQLPDVGPDNILFRVH